MLCDRLGGYFVAGLTMLLFFITPGALASSFSVDPVLVNLSSDQPTAALTIRNTQNSRATIEVEALSWSQQDGDDQLASTRELIAVPPIFTLESGEQQIVRVGLRKPMQAQSEQSYRLLFKEVPPPESAGQGLRIALNISLPVFIAPAGPIREEAVWRAKQLPGGLLRLSVENRGTVHWRSAELDVIRQSDNRSLANEKKLAYVLPGASRHWDFTVTEPLATGDELQVLTRNYGRTSHARVVVD